jgi:serine O-acetyltransferase
VDPGHIWHLSSRLHRRGWRRLAKLLKLVNIVLYRCFLPPEADVGPGVILYHRGLGVVVHQMVRVGRDVNIAHHVTIGVAGEQHGPFPRVIVEDGAMIGVGAVVLATPGRVLRIGSRAAVGANAVVTHDVAPGERVAGPRAQPTSRSR